MVIPLGSVRATVFLFGGSRAAVAVGDLLRLVDGWGGPQAGDGGSGAGDVHLGIVFLFCFYVLFYFLRWWARSTGRRPHSQRVAGLAPPPGGGCR